MGRKHFDAPSARSRLHPTPVTSTTNLNPQEHLSSPRKRGPSGFRTHNLSVARHPNPINETQQASCPTNILPTRGGGVPTCQHEIPRIFCTMKGPHRSAAGNLQLRASVEAAPLSPALSPEGRGRFLPNLRFLPPFVFSRAEGAFHPVLAVRDTSARIKIARTAPRFRRNDREKMAAQSRSQHPPKNKCGCREHSSLPGGGQSPPRRRQSAAPKPPHAGPTRDQKAIEIDLVSVNASIPS